MSSLRRASNPTVMIDRFEPSSMQKKHQRVTQNNPSEPRLCASKSLGKPGSKGPMPKFLVNPKERGAELRIYLPSKAKNRNRVLYRLGPKGLGRVYLPYDEAKREADAILRKISA